MTQGRDLAREWLLRLVEELQEKDPSAPRECAPSEGGVESLEQLRQLVAAEGGVPPELPSWARKALESELRRRGQAPRVLHLVRVGEPFEADAAPNRATRGKLAASASSAAYERVATLSTSDGSATVWIDRYRPENHLLAHVDADPGSGPYLLRLHEPDIELPVGPRGRTLFPDGVEVGDKTRVELVLPTAVLELEPASAESEPDRDRWILRGASTEDLQVEILRDGDRWRLSLRAPRSEDSESALRLLIESPSGKQWLAELDGGMAELRDLEIEPGASGAIFSME